MSGRIANTLLTVLISATTLAGQEPKAALPRVVAIEVPFYPPLARVAHVEGEVHIKITTDGHRVVATHVEDGHKLLAAAAEQNARTWQFATHEPTTFTLTYKYKLLTEWTGDPESPTVVLRLPTEVEVSIRRWPGTRDLPAEVKPTAHAVQTSVCEITRSPASFDGKMVRLRATVTSGFEVFGIRDPSNEKCGLIWLTYADRGPVASLSMRTKTPNVQRQPVKLKNDRQLKRFQKLLDAKMYPRTRGSICISCNRYEVTATMTGRLDYAGEGRGFGHMNAYDAQLVLASVSDVAATDLASNYDLKEYSPTPVRFPTGYLKGRVLAPDGRPVAKAEVNVISTEDVPPYLHDFTEWTDEKGRFKVAVPPGTYLLGINLETPPSPAVPFAATYYPGTADVSTAKKLSVADRQEVGGLVIRIPERLRERRIPVKVTWPDGTPVQNANVWLAEIRSPTEIVGGAVSHTGADGTFDLIGFEGIDYFLHADIYVKPRYTRHCAEVRTLKSGDAVPDRVVMVLTRTGDDCGAENHSRGSSVPTIDRKNGNLRLQIPVVETTKPKQ